MDRKKLLEIAGVDVHVKKETAVFAAVEAELAKLCAFLHKQEGNEYSDLCKESEALSAKLKKHLEKYK